MSFVYSRTAADIAKRALKLIRVIDAELPPAGIDRENAFDALNGFVKYLQTKGFNLWRETEAYLPLVKGQESYKLGPDGDICFDVDDFVLTQLAADQVTNDTLLTLNSTTGIEAAPNLFGFDPTTTTANWLVTDGTLSNVSGLVITNTTGAAEAQYSFDTEFGKTYIVEFTFAAGTALTGTAEITDIDGIITSTAVAASTSYRLEFVARQTTTNFVFRNGSAVATEDNTISLLSYIDKSQGDKLGVFLDDGTLFWTNVIYGAPFEVADGLPSDASTGNLVYSYTDLIPRPMSITNTRYRDNISASEIPTTDWTRKEYFEQPDKSSQGIVTKWYYTPQLDNGTLYVWQPASNTTSLLALSYIRPLEVTNENADKTDFPSEWFDLLSYGVAYRLIPEYSIPDRIAMMVQTQYGEILDSALGFDNDGSISIEIDYEGSMR